MLVEILIMDIRLLLHLITRESDSHEFFFFSSKKNFYAYPLLGGIGYG